MNAPCPTTQHIHTLARVAAGFGEATCETVIEGVRVTVHVPLEGPLSRRLAQDWIKASRHFVIAPSFLFATGIEPAPADWEQQLTDMNNGDAPAKGAHVVRALIVSWAGPGPKERCEPISFFNN